MQGYRISITNCGFNIGGSWYEIYYTSLPLVGLTKMARLYKFSRFVAKWLCSDSMIPLLMDMSLFSIRIVRTSVHHCLRLKVLVT